MAQVALQSVGKTYENGFVAVQDATFTVEDGEFLVLVGPSGCGKSTVLRMIAGLETVTVGEIRIDGGIVNEMAPRERDVAMVFQNYALYPHMSVFDNMAMGLKVRRQPAAQIRPKVEAAAQMLGLESILDRRPAQLSGGQRQRVAVGRAMVREPRVFLFDEPLSNLDAKMRVEMRTEISKLHHRLAATMVYVTHDQTEAMTMGDRIVVLDAGKVQQVAPPIELYNRPANQFVAGFIGNPAMNFWPARLDLEGDPVLELGSLRAPLSGTLPPELASLGGRPLVLGIRPEDLHLSPPDQALTAKVPATLEVVEPLGNETMLYAEVAGATTVLRTGPWTEAGPGSKVEIHADLTRSHWFDPSTQETIVSWPGRSAAATD